MYEKQNWSSGEVVSAEKLNHMEDGIANSGGATLYPVRATGQTTMELEASYNDLVASNGGIAVFEIEDDKMFYAITGFATIGGEYFVYIAVGSGIEEYSASSADEHFTGNI